MKTFNVLYEVTTSYDAIVKAKTKEEAREKVKEVIGEPITFGGIYEVKDA